MEDKIILKWSYTPKDYFEEPLRINREKYELEINNGEVTATFHGMKYENNNRMFEERNSEINDLFMGAQVVNHKSYLLLNFTIQCVHPNGIEDVIIIADPLEIKLSGTAELLIKDSQCNIVYDSRADRISERKLFAELAAKHIKKDPVAAAIVKSYHTAVNEPNNELIHLYEIRESLKKKFGNKKQKTKIALNITETEWKRLGSLANFEPLRQGRHRGKNPGQLRNATHQELTEARAIAKKMIFAYLKYLDGN